MKPKRKRSRKGGTSAAGTKRHLIPGVENQIGGQLALAEDKAVASAREDSPLDVRWLGEPGREREELKRVRARPLKEQVRIAVVGVEKFRGMGPGCIFDVVAGRELDGEECFKRLTNLEQRYSTYQRWKPKEERWVPVRMESPIEYRTISIPKFRSKALQRALKEQVVSPKQFRKLLRVASKILKREFRSSTKYPGADLGLEVELVLWHLQQGVLHAHLVFRKVDEAGKRLGLIGNTGKLVWNELELSLVAERRRRALEFQPIPKVLQNGRLVEDWSLLDRWTRSRVEGDDKSGKSRRARDRGLGDTWDMKVNDVVDSVLESFAFKRPELWKIWEEEEGRARKENQHEFELFREWLGISKREELDCLLSAAKTQIQGLTAQLEEGTAKAGKLSLALHEKTSLVENLRKSIAEAEHQIDELQKKLTTALAEHEELGRQGLSAKEQVNVLTDQIKEASGKANAMRDELAEKTRLVTELRKSLSDAQTLAKQQADALQQDLTSALAKVKKTETRLTQVRLNPLLLLDDKRTCLVVMADALKRVLNGFPPTALDLLFLQASSSHIGGYCLAPAFIVQAQSLRIKQGLEADALALLDLVRIGGFTAFETAAAATHKKRHSEVLTSEEQRILTSQGTVKPHILRAARFAVTIAKSNGHAAKPRKAHQWGAEAAELLEVVRLDAEMAKQPEVAGSPEIQNLESRERFCE